MHKRARTHSHTHTQADYHIPLAHSHPGLEITDGWTTDKIRSLFARDRLLDVLVRHLSEHRTERRLAVLCSGTSKRPCQGYSSSEEPTKRNIYFVLKDKWISENDEGLPWLK